MEILIADIPAIEMLVRTAVMYGFLLVAFQLAGKRQLGQMPPFDLIVVLVMNEVVARTSARFRGFERLVERETSATPLAKKTDT